MRKSTKDLIMIPKSFCIGGGKLFNVKIVDNIDHKSYGDFSDVESLIRIAKTITVDGKEVKISDEDKLRTYFHELIHCFNWMYNCECDEALAQTFSNFLYEYLNTKK